MSFTDAQKTDIRRFCGFPVFGGQATQAFGYRYFTQYGTLEYKLNNLLPSEEAVITTTYLANLYTLETAIVGASANLDTDEASVWKHNKREVADREALFMSWRMKLADFLGVGYGPALQGGGVRVVV